MRSHAAFSWIDPLVLVLSAAAVPAQQTWIVDAQSRPGTQFTDLPPAVDAARAGDILLVRDGSYTHVTITKGLQIHGQPGAIVDTATTFFAAAPVVIRDIPTTEIAVIHGLMFGSTSFGFPVYVEIEDCAGQVHLEDLTFSVGGSGFTFAGVSIARSSRVSLARCDIVGRSGLLVDQSSVFAHDCQLRGLDEIAGVHGLNFPAWPGVSVVGGTVELSRCTVAGGNGAGFWSTGGSPGLSMTNGQVTVTGILGTTITAGLPGTGFGPPGVEAIAGTGTVTLDPIVQLRPSGTGSAVGSGVQVDTAEIPSLTVSGAVRAAPLTGDLQTGPSQAFAILVGVPASALTTPFGSAWLDLTNVIVPFAGVTSPTGNFSWQIRIPGSLPYLGIVTTWQGVALTGGGIRLSNAGEYVVR